MGILLFKLLTCQTRKQKSLTPLLNVYWCVGKAQISSWVEQIKFFPLMCLLYPEHFTSDTSGSQIRLSTQQAIFQPGVLQFNSVYLELSVRSHGLRTQSHKTVPPSLMMPVSRSRSPGDPQILSDLLPIRESHSLSLGLGLSFARAAYRTQGNTLMLTICRTKVNLGGSHGVGVHVPPGMWMCSPTWKSLHINGVLWWCPHVGTIRYELRLQPLEDR